MTPLQLARAYATLGAYGVKRPVTLRKVDEPVPGERVHRSARRQRIAGNDGKRRVDWMAAAIAPSLLGYRVAGKTGTAWTADGGSYNTDRIKASFGGVVPASQPRLAAIVIIDEPERHQILRRRRRRASVRQRHGGRTAFDGRAAGRPGSIACHHAGAGEPQSMRTAAATTTMNTRADNVRSKNLRALLADSGVSSAISCRPIWRSPISHSIAVPCGRAPRSSLCREHARMASASRRKL